MLPACVAAVATKMATCDRHTMLKLLLLVLLVGNVSLVDRGNFKTCEQSGFCKRNRNMKPGDSAYEVQVSSMRTLPTKVEVDVVNTKNGVVLRLELIALEHDILRMRLNEASSPVARFEPKEALVDTIHEQKILLASQDDKSFKVKFGRNSATVNLNPFSVELYSGEQLVIIANARGLMRFEHYRPKEQSKQNDNPDADAQENAQQSNPFLVSAPRKLLHATVHTIVSVIDQVVTTLAPPAMQFLRAIGVLEETEDNLDNVLEDPEDGHANGDEDEASTAHQDEQHEEVHESDLVEVHEVSEDNEAENEVKQPADEENMDGAWEETFKGHVDSKKNGPMSVGMDFTFEGFDHVYGIPEHADAFALRSTVGSTDPYRLYNLDVFEYDVNNPMALYGSVPYMIAHSESRTVGLVWLNAAETWIDIEPNSKQGVLSSVVDFVKRSPPPNKRDTHWFSESGLIDTFFLLGPSAKDVMLQYKSIAGATPLPPLFSIAYHQSRWNYNDQEDVRNVDGSFDNHDIPYDAIWLDIEHTDGKKYFTWDSFKFPDPEVMIRNLTGKGRRMITIIDPHIKRESGYFIHSEATDRGYYVKNKDGNDYDGWCWPGSSSYLDFFNPEVRHWWASKFSLDNYKGSTELLFTWNDMNEPSVFNGPEVTMHKDCKHTGGWEHRDVHNMYGMMLPMSTYMGHLLRSENSLRPFILSRSFFIGSQRYGAVWTGDNTADWNHLKITVPMMLTLSVTGISFSGADVGGFFRNTDGELSIRWYQAGAFQPFFRAHSHIDTKRREPWMFGEEATRLIRAAVRMRYAYLPLWYTLFFENDRAGIPPMRPLWMEFPTDRNGFATDDEYMIGKCLLVHPVTDAGASKVTVYFPGDDKEVWYDVETQETFTGGSSITIPVTLSKVPVFQRGGTIIPKKERIRRCSALGREDPYTLQIALNREGDYAEGDLYVDDGVGFRYRNGDLLLLKFHMEGSTISSKLVEGPGSFKTSAWLERIRVSGFPSQPSKVLIQSGSSSEELRFQYQADKKLLTIRKPGVNIGAEWTINIQ
ncbi:neutral alpha-glucosidase AB-like isoform X3 [Ornithodoros turicata]|uniref:neutral alpha-glucosidase AB-like isoform X3 n=1 Tax=Ornithodoros turicata TaxID=34597 RepID=UPI003138A0C1